MNYPYNDAYWPDFPVLNVELCNEDDGFRTKSIVALLDTGADASMVPMDLLRQIQAYVIGSSHVRSHWGDRHEVYLFQIDVKLDQITLPGITVIGDEHGDEVVLGRDVLNKLRLLLDGPTNQTELLD